MAQAASEWSLPDAIRPGIEAVKAYWAPFLLIQLAAAALVVAYYQVESVQAWADEIGVFKDRLGLAFSAIGGFIAAGIVPEIAKLLTGRLKKFDGEWLRNSAYNGFVYAVVASQVDLFYRFQAFVFGPQVDFKTIAIKTAVDMALFAPFLCMPTGVLLFDWRANGYRVGKLVREVNRVWFRERVVPTIIPGWAFWIPALLGLYALPLPVQMPLALLLEAAWSIIFIFVAGRPAVGDTAHEGEGYGPGQGVKDSG